MVNIVGHTINEDTNTKSIGVITKDAHNIPTYCKEQWSYTL